MVNYFSKELSDVWVMIEVEYVYFVVWVVEMYEELIVIYNMLVEWGVNSRVFVFLILWVKFGLYIGVRKWIGYNVCVDISYIKWLVWRYDLWYDFFVRGKKM